MVKISLAIFLLAATLAFAQEPGKNVSPNKTDSHAAAGNSHNAPASPVELPAERRLSSVRQLTSGGENAEAYFGGDGQQLIFQSKRDGRGCDQIYTMRADGDAGTPPPKMVSTGGGATTCSYIFPNGKRILYASTHLAGEACPPRPDFSKGYVWPIHPSFDIFTARADGSDLKRLTETPGYDAEATVSVNGKKIVFTSMRGGDLDLYSMNADGRNVRRLTDALGYDGGAFFSRDGKQIVYRAYHPQTPEQIARYRQKLAEHVIEPNVFEVWVMNADGTNKRQVTRLGAASFAPYFFPDGKRIIFSSNVNDPKGRNFDLYAIGTDGTNLERVTFNDTFDGFPMFSPDGKRLVFASNRNAKVRGETNVFIADWVEASTGKIEGVVVDVNEARIANAIVKIKGRGLTKKLETDEEGRFEVELHVGSYQINIVQNGFHSFHKKLLLSPGSGVKLNVTLDVAAWDDRH